MTNKLKCPFCGEELEPTSGYGIGLYSCPNLTCQGAPGYAEDGVWQALIKAKQDLVKAIDVIDTVRQYKRGTAVICPNDIVAYCDRALEQITHDNSEKANSVEHKE